MNEIITAFLIGCSLTAFLMHWLVVDRLKANFKRVDRSVAVAMRVIDFSHKVIAHVEEVAPALLQKAYEAARQATPCGDPTCPRHGRQKAASDVSPNAPGIDTVQ